MFKNVDLSHTSSKSDETSDDGIVATSTTLWNRFGDDWKQLKF